MIEALRIALQVWGGGFYLLNKVFFSFAERSEGERKQTWQIWSWIVYIIGVPAWVIILIFEQNWMVALVELGGVPAMIMGLIFAIERKKKDTWKWLDYIARICAVAGIAVSLYVFGGLTKITQLYELGTVLGFLIGTYLLAKQRPVGYLWFILMNVSNAALMAAEHYPWLVAQQLLSLVFVIDAYLVEKGRAGVSGE